MGVDKGCSAAIVDVAPSGIDRHGQQQSDVEASKSFQLPRAARRSLNKLDVIFREQSPRSLDVREFKVGRSVVRENSTVKFSHLLPAI